MKLQDLKNTLNSLDEEQLDCEVIVYDTLSRFYLPVRAFRVRSFNEVLDKDQPFLVFDGTKPMCSNGNIKL